MIAVHPVRAFTDNYIWLIAEEARGTAAVVDPGEAQCVLAALDARGLRPVAILVTHHHRDHVGGIAELRSRFAVPVFAPAAEPIAERTHAVSDGQRLSLPGLDLEVEVLEVPGHTAGGVAYWGQGMLFSGDTLFAAGCGRLFEGTAAQMLRSLGRLASLPESTLVYCGHEYTLANLHFAAAVEPDNREIAARLAATRRLHAQKLAAVPSTLAMEKRTNPFLRCAEPAVRASAERLLGRPARSLVEVFAAIRSYKDRF